MGYGSARGHAPSELPSSHPLFADGLEDGSCKEEGTRKHGSLPISGEVQRSLRTTLVFGPNLGSRAKGGRHASPSS